MKKTFMVTLVLTFIINQNAHAASATADAVQVVESAISISAVSDLNFGVAIQGDEEKEVAAGTSENNENASFLVRGEPGKSFTVTLPVNDSIKMFHGADTSITDPKKLIEVNDFTSSAGETNGNVLDASGEKLLFVGATRSFLLADQERGQYSGSFEVTVVY